MKKVKLIIFFIVFLNVISLKSQSFSSELLFSKTADAIVVIQNGDNIGTGFFINEEGWIVTNRHVLENRYEELQKPNQFKIELRSGKVLTPIEFIDLYKSTKLDLCLVKTNYKSKDYLPFSIEKINVGEDVVAIGHPIGLKWTQTKGTVTNIQLFDEGQDILKNYILIDAAINPGNSGGPLINKYGQVIGINTFKITIIENSNVSIKVSKLLNELEKRRIYFYTDKQILETLSFDELTQHKYLEDLKRLQNEKDEFILEKKKFQLMKDNFNKEVDSLKVFYNNDYNSKILDLQNRVHQFELKIKESDEFLKNTDKLKKELDDKRKDLENRIDIIEQKERSLEKKEQWIDEKQNNIYKALNRHFSIAATFLPAYSYDIMNSESLLNFSGQIGFDFHFGIESDSRNNLISNRLGIFYQSTALYNFNSNKLSDDFLKFNGAYLEIQSKFRLSGGVNFSYDNILNMNNLLSVSYNLNNYPYPINIFTSIIFDNDLNNKIVNVGLSFGLDYSFLKW